MEAVPKLAGPDRLCPQPCIDVVYSCTHVLDYDSQNDWAKHTDVGGPRARGGPLPVTN
jgi:hypothetical protein